MSCFLLLLLSFSTDQRTCVVLLFQRRATMDQADFESKPRQTLKGKAENAVLQSTTRRDQLLEDLLKIHSFGANSPFDFNLKKRYEVLRVGNADRLIRRRKDPNEDEFKFIALNGRKVRNSVLQR